MMKTIIIMITIKSNNNDKNKNNNNDKNNNNSDNNVERKLEKIKVKPPKSLVTHVTAQKLNQTKILLTK